jgi:uncharacterized membrane-anchored protein
MSLFLRLIVILAAMLAFLIAMMVTHAQHRANGQEIILDMEPVDPRDMLLGYYSRLTTNVHQLDMADIEGPKLDWQSGDRIFVGLQPVEDGSWQAVSALREHPGTGVYLQGRVRSAFTLYDWQTADGQPGNRFASGSERIPGTERDGLRLVYNLEAYYAEADAARELDDLRDDNQLRLIVSLADDGRAVIKGLEINGERRVDSLFATEGAR